MLSTRAFLLGVTAVALLLAVFQWFPSNRPDGSNPEIQVVSNYSFVAESSDSNEYFFLLDVCGSVGPLRIDRLSPAGFEGEGVSSIRLKINWGPTKTDIAGAGPISDLDPVFQEGLGGSLVACDSKSHSTQVALVIERASPLHTSYVDQVDLKFESGPRDEVVTERNRYGVCGTEATPIIEQC